MSPERILLREGFRSDSLWSNRFITSKYFDRIPFTLDLRALLKSQYWPRERLDALVLKNIEKTLQNAANIPFWAERLKNAGINGSNTTLDDLRKLPVLTKKDFRDSTEDQYTAKTLMPLSHSGRSSGSTGTPFRFFHDPAFVMSSYSLCERFLLCMGNGKRYPVINMRPTDKPGFAFNKYHFFFLHGYSGIKHRLPDLQNFMGQYPEGVLLSSFGSSLVELAKVCAAEDITLPIRGLMYGGEMLSLSRRQEIEKALKTRIHSLYGTNELGRLAFECKEGREHINEERVYIEILNEDDEALPPGTRGRIVATIFDNRVMPFIRYEIGDLGTIHEECCPCGRTLKTLSIQGRQIHLLQFGPDRSIPLLNLTGIFDRYWEAVQQFQIVRTEEYRLRVRVVTASKFALKQQKILENLAKTIHPSAIVTWEIVESIPEGAGGKAVVFIDGRDKEAEFTTS